MIQLIMELPSYTNPNPRCEYLHSLDRNLPRFAIHNRKSNCYPMAATTNSSTLSHTMTRSDVTSPGSRLGSHRRCNGQAMGTLSLRGFVAVA